MDDIDMMDEDIILEAPAATTTTTTAQPQGQQQPGGPVPEAYFMDLDEIGKIVHEKVHANGVDDMSTEQVTAWADGHTAGADVKLKKVEWIDDSSCNLIYASIEEADKALELLTEGEPSKEQVEDRLLFRPSKGSATHPMAKLRVRIAKDTDRKQKGARERSRFYLFNPEYDRAEQMDRRRGDRGGRRGGDRRRQGRDLENGDYEKRQFDDREHRRRRDDEAEDFDVGMYDDEPSASGRDRRPPRRDRSRSPGGYRNRDSYRSRRTRSRSPQRKEAIELFPEKVSKNNVKHGLLASAATDYTSIADPVPTPIMDESTLGPRREPRSDRPPRNMASRLGLAIKATAGSGGASSSSAGRSLADRIEFPAKPLSDRISLPENDLFADKMRNAERSHSGRLNADDEEGSGSGGRRRNRGSRRRAHEMFGGE